MCIYTQAIEKKMKHLERTPGSLQPPDPATILHNLPWLSGLEGDVVDTILTYAEFIHLEQTDWLLEEGVESRGIYVIVSGLVKVCVSLFGLTHINMVILISEIFQGVCVCHQLG